MKKRFDHQIHQIALLGACMMLAGSCTKETVPELTTTPVTYLSEQSVTCTGNVTNDGGADVVEWGICWRTAPNPTTANQKIAIASASGDFTCTLDGLASNTQYFVRAYAINSAGTGYGPEISFRTWNEEMVTDVDGNRYHTVTIGTQVWQVENLKVTHYRGGDPIGLITPDAE